jgi:hypothetical protein
VAAQLITLETFQDLVDRLGADAERWPAAERAEAEALLEASEPARRILEEARALKMALSGPAVTAPAGLKQRILDAAFDEKPVPKAKERRG